jgi:hypothetical protein
MGNASTRADASGEPVQAATDRRSTGRDTASGDTGQRRAVTDIHASPRMAMQRRQIDAAFGAAARRPSTNHVASPVQLQPISEDEAKATLERNMAACHDLPDNVFLSFSDPESPDANCHGYTMTENVGSSVSGNFLLQSLDANSPPIVVFVKNGEIAHSGRLKNGRLHHLVIGVGVLSTALGGSLLGYDSRYTLPADRAALDAYLLPGRQRQIRSNRISDIASIMRREAHDNPHDDTIALHARQMTDLQDDEDLEDGDDMLQTAEAFLVNRRRLESAAAAAAQEGEEKEEEQKSDSP